MTAAAKPPRAVHAKQTVAGITVVAVLIAASLVVALLVAPR